MTRFRRRVFLAAIAIFTVLVLLFVGYFFHCGRDYARVSLPQKYWLLSRDCKDTTASAIIGESYVSGGAGYLVETGGNQSVALACYYAETTARSVQEVMTGKGVETRVTEICPEDVELNGGAAAHAGRIAANADTADTCTRILYDAANGLERTEVSQEEARTAVRGVVKSLKGLAAENKGRLYERWNAELARICRKGTELSEGILFARDLRYLQVWLCIFVTDAADYFA